jgi:hypothetical protein
MPLPYSITPEYTPPSTPHLPDKHPVTGPTVWAVEIVVYNINWVKYKKFFI